jgi:hypothetical protein
MAMVRLSPASGKSATAAALAATQCHGFSKQPGLNEAGKEDLDFPFGGLR